MQIDIFGDIGLDVTFLGVREKLSEADGKEINLYVNSGGGSVIEGNAIYNLIKGYKGKVNAHIDFAASMATYIVLAADEISMAENGFFMIHNPWGFAVGDADEIETTVGLLRKMQADIKRKYAKKTGLQEEELQGYMGKDSWFSAQEAFDLGFVDKITELNEMVAHISDEKIREKYLSLVATATSKQKQKEEVINMAEQKEDAKSLIAKLGEMLGLGKEENAENKAVAEDLKAKSDVNLVAQIEGLKARIDQIEGLKAEAEKEIKEAKEAKEEAEEIKKDAETKVDEANEAVAIAKAKVESLCKGFEGSGDQAGSVYEQFNALKGAEKTEFYLKHSAEIDKQSKEK